MAVSPTARGLILCEKVTVDPASRNLTLENCFRSLRADRFPAHSDPIYATAHLVNGLGEVVLRLVIASLNDDREVYRFVGRVRFEERLQEMRVKIEISQFIAHAPGRFAVELWANDDLIAQTDFVIRGGVS